MSTKYIAYKSHLYLIKMCTFISQLILRWFDVDVFVSLHRIMFHVIDHTHCITFNNVLSVDKVNADRLTRGRIAGLRSNSDHCLTRRAQ